jgi:NAD-dependent DNA ligase
MLEVPMDQKPQEVRDAWANLLQILRKHDEAYWREVDSRVYTAEVDNLRDELITARLWYERAVIDWIS